MGKQDKQEIKHKTVMNRAQVAAYLNDLAASLIKGTICIQKGDDQVVFYPTENVKVEIEAEVKKNKYEFSLELEWVREIESEEAEVELSISANAPEQTAQVAPEAEVAPEPEKCEKDDDEDDRYKDLKKKMKKAWEEIKEYKEKQEIPPLNLVESFWVDCQEMTTFPDKGDEYYEQFNAQAYDLFGAAQSGDFESFSAGCEALGLMKSECHDKYK